MPNYRRALRPDAQPFDEIRIVMVPRYKTSGISGDEWRISAAIRFIRKGEVVHEEYYGNKIESAASALPYLLNKAIEDGHARFVTEGDFCDQEGCQALAAVTYKVKKEVCDECGEKKDWSNGLSGQDIWIRRFCKKHATRGDCGIDDTDSNYEVIEEN